MSWWSNNNLVPYTGGTYRVLDGRGVQNIFLGVENLHPQVVVRVQVRDKQTSKTHAQEHYLSHGQTEMQVFFEPCQVAYCFQNVF